MDMDDLLEREAAEAVIKSMRQVSRFTTHQHILGPQAMWKVFLDGKLIGFIKQEVDEFRFTPRDSVVPGDAFVSMEECLGSLFISDEQPVDWKHALQVSDLI